MAKLNPSSFRRGVNWLGLLLLSYFIAFVGYSFLLAPLVKQMYVDDRQSRAYGIILLFSLLYWLAFTFVTVVRGKMSYSETRTSLLKAAREEGFSPWSYFARTFLPEYAWKTAFFAVVQLPFTFFYGAFGIAIDDTAVFFDKFFIAVAGFYTSTGSAFFGWLLSCVFFFAVMVLVTLVKYLLMLRDQ